MDGAEGRGDDERTSKECFPTGSLQKDSCETEDRVASSPSPFNGPVTRTRSRSWGYFHVSLPTQSSKRRYTRGGEKVCPICRKLTKSPSDLERHVRVHTGERPFQCVECRKPFKCKRSQQSHQYLYHGISDGMSQSRIDLLACQKMLKQWPSKDIENNENRSSAPERNVTQEMASSLVESTEDNGHTQEAPNKENLSSVNNNVKCLEVGEDGSAVVLRNESENIVEDSDAVRRIEKVYKEKRSTLLEEADRMVSSIGESETLTKSVPQNEKVDTANVKPVTCHRCGRGFKTIYTLRYHQRAIHGLMVYLSPALEDRLLKKKGCWRRSGHLRRPTMVPVPCVQDEKESDHQGKLVNNVDSLDKISRLDSLSKGQCLGNKNGSGQRVLIGDIEKCVSYVKPLGEESASRTRHFSFPLNKEGGIVPTCEFNRIVDSSFGYPLVPEICAVPSPHILLPNPHLLRNGEVGAELQLSWQSIRIESEKVFVARVEAINPTTEQRYVLYKCCLCGSAFPGLKILCSHLIGHTRECSEKICELCGAIFKWPTELEFHRHHHQSKDNMVPNSFQPNFFPTHLVPCTAGAPIVPRSESGSMMPNHESDPPKAVSDPLQVTSLLSPNFCPLYSPMSPLPLSLRPDNSHNQTVATGRVKNKRVLKGSQLTFQCRHCPKIFDRIFSLQRHERVHTGVKPCFCTVCGRGFSELRNLRHHNIRFHPDGCHKELLPRGRRPGRPRNISTSMKLVSSLKKTAVRILNSVEQQKLDALSVNDPERVPDQVSSGLVDLPNRPCDIGDRDDTRPSVITVTPDVSVAKGPQEKQLLEKSPDNESVTVVIPTDVSQGVSLPSREFSSPSGEFSNESQENHSREVLQDPKRSLIGNRRKCRPFKLVPQGQQEKIVEVLPAEKYSTPHSLDVPADPSEMIACNEDVDFQQSQEPRPQTLEEMQFPDNSTSGEQNAKITEEGSLNFKTRLRGHGAFFSSYNPRLGVVARPVLRTEACKPQLGPDGKYLYPCSYCFKTFCSTSDLNRHMDFHEDIRPFKCPYCEYCSRTNSQLKVHMMRHQGIKQYLCQICNYNGVTQSDLNRHLKTRTHFLRSRNICSCCGIGFYTRSLSEEHYRICHQLKNSTLQTPTTTEQCGDSIKPITHSQGEMSNVQANNKNMCTYFNGTIPVSSGRNAFCKERLEEKNNNDYHFNLKHTPVSTPDRAVLSSNEISGPNLLSAS